MELPESFKAGGVVLHAAGHAQSCLGIGAWKWVIQGGTTVFNTA
ncbi:MAG TPA: hypothetical protein VFY31_04600 [Macromonas sp.]|nr:hypothetical protein [Macromonas sp.]